MLRVQESLVEKANMGLSFLIEGLGDWLKNMESL
jgi:hypothetical protein